MTNETNESNQSFEESVTELNNILSQLDNGNTTLDESIDLFSRGMHLVSKCRKQLEQAKDTIDSIIRKADEEMNSVKTAGEQK